MVFCKVLGFQVSGLRFNPNFAVFCKVFGFGSCFEVWVLGFRVEGFRVSGYRSFLRFRVSVFWVFFGVWGRVFWGSPSFSASVIPGGQPQIYHAASAEAAAATEAINASSEEQTPQDQASRRASAKRHGP